MKKNLFKPKKKEFCITTTGRMRGVKPGLQLTAVLVEEYKRYRLRIFPSSSSFSFLVFVLIHRKILLDIVLSYKVCAPLILVVL
jgi:hypothetical protein